MRYEKKTKRFMVVQSSTFFYTARIFSYSLFILCEYIYEEKKAINKCNIYNCNKDVDAHTTIKFHKSSCKMIFLHSFFVSCGSFEVENISITCKLRFDQHCAPLAGTHAKISCCNLRRIRSKILLT